MMVTKLKIRIKMSKNDGEIYYSDAVDLLRWLYNKLSEANKTDLIDEIRNSNVLTQYIVRSFDKEKYYWNIITSNEIIIDFLKELFSRVNVAQVTRYTLKDIIDNKNIHIDTLADNEIKEIDEETIIINSRKDYFKIKIETPLNFKSNTNIGVYTPNLDKFLKNAINKYVQIYNADYDEVKLLLNSLMLDKYQLKNVISTLKYKNDPKINIDCLQGFIRYRIPSNITKGDLLVLNRLAHLCDFTLLGNRNKYGYGKCKITFGAI